MQNAEATFVYGHLSPKEKEGVIHLWTRCGVVSLAEAQKRVEQVSTLITCNEKIIGVSTVYVCDFAAPNTPYFYFRMFIEEAFRGSNALRTQVMQVNFHELKKQYGDTIYGLVLELENTKLAHLGEKTDFMRKRGYTYFGKSARGLQLWYVRFDEPKGIFCAQ